MKQLNLKSLAMQAGPNSVAVRRRRNRFLNHERYNPISKANRKKSLEELKSRLSVGYAFPRFPVEIADVKPLYKRFFKLLDQGSWGGERFKPGQEVAVGAIFSVRRPLGGEEEIGHVLFRIIPEE